MKVTVENGNIKVGNNTLYLTKDIFEVSGVIYKRTGDSIKELGKTDCGLIKYDDFDIESINEKVEVDDWVLTRTYAKSTKGVAYNGKTYRLVEGGALVLGELDNIQFIGSNPVYIGDNECVMISGNGKIEASSICGIYANLTCIYTFDDVVRMLVGKPKFVGDNFTLYGNGNYTVTDEDGESVLYMVQGDSMTLLLPGGTCKSILLPEHKYNKSIKCNVASGFYRNGRDYLYRDGLLFDLNKATIIGKYTPDEFFLQLVRDTNIVGGEAYREEGYTIRFKGANNVLIESMTDDRIYHICGDTLDVRKTEIITDYVEEGIFDEDMYYSLADNLAVLNNGEGKLFVAVYNTNGEATVYSKGMKPMTVEEADLVNYIFKE